MTESSLRDALENLAEWLLDENKQGVPSSVVDAPEAFEFASTRLLDLLHEHPAEPDTTERTEALQPFGMGVNDEAVAKALRVYLADQREGAEREDAMRAALEAAAPLMGATPRPSLETVTECLAAHMADSWMGDEVDCADVGSILAPAVLALMGGADNG